MKNNNNQRQRANQRTNAAVPIHRTDKDKRTQKQNKQTIRRTHEQEKKINIISDEIIA